MSTHAIKVDHLGKRFFIGGKAEPYKTLRQSINDAVLAPVKRMASAFGGPKQASASEEFWALKDISFEIPRGEVVGIIGRNGAGKSTLLKILSKITDPTEGRIELSGRVGSLLEVGTGFHPELTGRENIFLNGAILGMRRAEILKKFDEIVAFSEIEKFLDTPVKHYSSGMYTRLAFAVAAHLEPDILMIDEVLAVGDASFQKKCLGKMDDVAKHGRTVLFVSHNMEAVLKLCKTGIVLQNGKVQKIGPIADAIEFYQHQHNAEETVAFKLDEDREKPHFKHIQLLQSTINYGDELEIEVELGSGKQSEVAIEIEIHDSRDYPLIYVSNAPMSNQYVSIIPGGKNKHRIRLGPLHLASGEYKVYFWLAKPWVENYHIVPTPLQFNVELSDPMNSGFNFKQSYRRGATTTPMTISPRNEDAPTG